MTVDVNVLAHLSAAAYRHYNDVNEILEPTRWEQIAIVGNSDDPITGFSAAAYCDRTTGEVVISFCGTNSDLLTGAGWWHGNIPAAGEYFSLH